MSKFLQLPVEEQIKHISNSKFLLNLPEVAIEKDIWVTAVLRALFALPYADSISFKGGTSLRRTQFQHDD